MLNNIDNRSKILYLNTLGSLFLRGGNIIVSFILIPLLISFLTDYEYGVWVALANIVGWLNYFDIGLGNGLKNKLGEALASNNLKLAKGYISSAYVVLTLFSLILYLLFFVVNEYLNWNSILNIDSSKIINLRAIINIVFISTLLGFVLKLIDSVLLAYQKTSISNANYTISQILVLIYIFYLKSSLQENALLFSIIGLAFMPIIVKLVYTLYFFLVKKREVKPSLGSFQLNLVSSIFSLGIKFFIIQIGVLVMFQTQNFIILKFLDAEKVTIYNISYKLLTCLYMLFSIIMAPFWAGVIEAFAKNDFYWLKIKIKELFLVLIILSILISLILAFYSEELFKVWLGKEFVIDDKLKYSLIIYSVLLSSLTIAMNFINGTGKVTIQMYSYLLGIVLNIPLSVFLIKHNGLSGVVMASNLIFFVMNTLLWYQTYIILNNKAYGIWNR